MLLLNTEPSLLEQVQMRWGIAAHVYEVSIVASLFFLIVFKNVAQWLELHILLLLLGFGVFRDRISDSRRNRLLSFFFLSILWSSWLFNVRTRSETSVHSNSLGLLLGIVALTFALVSPWVPAPYAPVEIGR